MPNRTKVYGRHRSGSCEPLLPACNQATQSGRRVGGLSWGRRRSGQGRRRQPRGEPRAPPDGPGAGPDARKSTNTLGRPTVPPRTPLPRQHGHPHAVPHTDTLAGNGRGAHTHGVLGSPPPIVAVCIGPGCRWQRDGVTDLRDRGGRVAEERRATGALPARERWLRVRWVSMHHRFGLPLAVAVHVGVASVYAVWAVS